MSVDNAQSTQVLMDEKTESTATVDFDGPEDPSHPLNWPIRKKAAITVCYGLLSSCTTWGTSMSVATISALYPSCVSG